MKDLKSNLRTKNFLFSLLLSLLFFLTLLFTLKDYGVSWDEAMHYRRAHALLHYFLTGERDYKNLQTINLQGTEGDPRKIPQPRRSFYQNDINNFTYFYDDWGHPPLNGLIAGIFNYILFQELGLMDDISAHHLFNILASTLLVFLVTYFAFSKFGKFGGIVAYLSLVTYPLFFAESHFNVKDPAETAFITGTILAFYKSLEKLSIKWLLLSIIFSGFALGTKFNILFVIFIIGPYLFLRYREKPPSYKNLFSNKKFVKYFKFLISIGWLIPVLFLVVPWPYLWINWRNIIRVLLFYKEIGTGTNYQGQEFVLAGFNTFPVLWIILTTPILILVFLSVGIYVAFRKNHFKDKLPLLLILWLVMPILRVSLPGFSIYGGVRQIMEFLPAMVLLAGLGTWKIQKWSESFTRIRKLNTLLFIACLGLFLFPIINLVKYHPYQNTYFNAFIGGLKGAKESDFPSWGNTYGSAYLEGIKWINTNVPNHSKLTLIQGTRANVPEIYLRKDMIFDNSNFSGIDREGEYIMELSFNDTAKFNYYAWDYVEKFLEPVFEIKRDNVALLKIWKNDLSHTKKESKLNHKKYENFTLSITDQVINLSFAESLKLSYIEVSPQTSKGCGQVKDGYLEISNEGNNWERKNDLFELSQVNPYSNKVSQNFRYFFAADNVKFIKILVDKNACILKDSKIDVYYFD